MAGPGNILIVSDYAQLELRLLACLSGCTPMIRILEEGGDFHSRTAAQMFPEVQDALDRGEIKLEDSDDGPSLTVKDGFPEERKKAKALNFSILYGKTDQALAADWGVSVAEARRIVATWYQTFPQIEAWQEQMRAEALQTCAVRTLLGRSRRLPQLTDGGALDDRVRSAALRMAINTPVQGSAADVMTLAMVKLHCSKLLRDLGFKMVNQIHDEVVLEGPASSVSEALREVVNIMENPFPFKVQPRLVVDARKGQTWLEAKG